MNVNLTLQEAEHLLRFNTGYLSCDHPDHGYQQGCEIYERAKKKIELAIENERVNGQPVSSGVDNK